MILQLLNGPFLLRPMKLNHSTYNNQRIAGRRLVPIVVATAAILLALTSALAQLELTKRITAMQVGRTDTGSRVSVFSNSALNDFEAFRRGDRFYVKLPRTAFATSRPSFIGAGFQDIQVQESGGSVLLSFKLQPGANARVDEHPNRLDVVFWVPVEGTANTPKTTQSNPDSIPGLVVLQNSRPRLQHNPDAAGPVPPVTPVNNRPRVVSPADERTVAVPTTQRSHVQRDALQIPKAVDVHPNALPATSESKPAVDPWQPTNKSDALTTAGAPSTTANPVNQPTPSWQSSQRLPTIATQPVRSQWLQRRDLITKWIAANRIVAGGGGAALLGLVVIGGTMLFRRKRKIKTTSQRLPGVQPKYSPEDELGGFAPHQTIDSADKDIIDDYVSDLADSGSGFARTPATVPFEDPQDDVFHWVEGGDDLSSTTEPWVQPVSSIPNYAMQIDESEREVFEL